jgi:hypothetical protein
MSRLVKWDEILLGGEGGFLVRGDLSDVEVKDRLNEYVGPVVETSPMRHGWFRWIPDRDEGGVLLYDAEPYSRGAFQAVLVDEWCGEGRKEGRDTA